MTVPTDLDCLRETYQYAAEHSTDPSTQNGALLVYEGGILIKAANHFPRDVKETPERWERPLKYSFVEHAERNLVYKAARMGIPTEGCVVYCPWFACDNCARALIQAGIKEVVGHDADFHKTRPDWYESIRLADEMLTEAGVKFRRVPGKVGGVRIRFNGQMIEP